MRPFCIRAYKIAVGCCTLFTSSIITVELTGLSFVEVSPLHSPSGCNTDDDADPFAENEDEEKLEDNKTVLEDC